MSKHTPGPWRLDHNGNSMEVVVYGVGMPGTMGDWPLAACSYSGTPNLESHTLANARLIAAAPDLLAACESVKASLTLLYPHMAEELSANIAANIHALAVAITKATQDHQVHTGDPHMTDGNIPACPTCRGAMPSALVAGRVQRPAIPARNSADCGTNSLATAVAAVDVPECGECGLPDGKNHSPGCDEQHRAHSGGYGQSERTGASTAAILNRNDAGAGLSPVGMDAPKPGADIVREYARLSLVADADLALWLSIKTPPMPGPESSVEVWREYTEALVASRRLDAAFSVSNRAAQDYRTANLAALKAALGVE